MKAVLHTQYGPPDELELKDIAKPVPGDKEILIKIRATTVTTSDCNMRNLTFVPRLLWLPVRLEFGLMKPKNSRLGLDLSGDVEAVGKGVTRFQVGDPIFGTTEPAYGAHAEYVCLPEDGVLAPKPTNMTYEQAATIPVIANTALYYVRDLGNVQAGEEVLINGASGGIGTFAVQIAKHYGAHVTGVCGTRNLDMVKSLGADQVIDYTREDFTQTGQTYDVIFDAVGKSSFSRCKGALKQNGLYLDTLPRPATLLQMLWTSRIGSKKVRMAGAPADLENLLALKELIETGRLTTVIDRRYPLAQIAKAYRYVEEGHKRGNIVITVEHNDET